MEKTIVLPPSPNGNGHLNYRLTVFAPKRRYLQYLRERWWVVLLCLALTLGGILTYEIFRPESYSSYAQLYMSGEVQFNNFANLLNEESQTYFGTQIELLKSVRLQSAALARIHYMPAPREKAPVTLEVFQPMKTSILVLQATARDPDLARRFLQALIEEYLAYKKETHISSTEDIVASLTDQLAQREKDLRGEQDRWAEFQKSNNVAVLEEEGKSAGLYLSELNLQRAKLRLEQQLLAAGLSAATNDPAAADEAMTNGAPNSAALLSDGGSGTNSVSDIALSDSALKSARVELAIRRAERDRVLADRGQMAARHLDDDVARLQRTVGILENQVVRDKRAELDALEKRIAAIETSIPSWEAKVLSINNRLSDSLRLKNNMSRQQDYYDHLLTLLQNVDLGKNVQQERLSVLQPATPAMVVNRYVWLRIAGAAVLGILLGAAIVFVCYLLDDRFVSVADVKDQFGEAVLGLIPQIKVAKSKSNEALLKSNDSRRAYSESYRHLRSALICASQDGPGGRIVLLTGTAINEGKTTVAINLARVLARSGFKVALVDADLERGKIDRTLGVAAEQGLRDYLDGRADLNLIQRAADEPGLTLIPSGTAANGGEGMFLRPRLAEALEELKKRNDFVILDGPPIPAADDAALLAQHADAVVLVVRPFYSRSQTLRATLDMLYQRKAKRVNIVFNRAKKDDVADYSAAKT